MSEKRPPELVLEEFSYNGAQNFEPKLKVQNSIFFKNVYCRRLK